MPTAVVARKPMASAPYITARAMCPTMDDHGPDDGACDPPFCLADVGEPGQLRCPVGPGPEASPPPLPVQGGSSRPVPAPKIAMEENPADGVDGDIRPRSVQLAHEEDAHDDTDPDGRPGARIDSGVWRRRRRAWARDVDIRAPPRRCNAGCDDSGHADTGAFSACVAGSAFGARK